MKITTHISSNKCFLFHKWIRNDSRTGKGLIYEECDKCSSRRIIVESITPLNEAIASIDYKWLVK